MYIYICIYLHIVDMMSMNAHVHSTSTRALTSIQLFSPFRSDIVSYPILSHPYPILSHLFVVNSNAMAPPKLQNRCMHEYERDAQRSAAAAAAAERDAQRSQLQPEPQTIERKTVHSSRSLLDTVGV